MTKLQDQKVQIGQSQTDVGQRAGEYLAVSSAGSDLGVVGGAGILPATTVDTGLRALNLMLDKFDKRGYLYAESASSKAEFDKDLADLRNEVAQRMGMKSEDLELRLVRNPSYTGLKGQDKYLLVGSAKFGDKSHNFILTWQGDLVIANDQDAFAKFLAATDRLEAKAHLEKAIRFPVKEIGPQHVPLEFGKHALEQAAVITQKGKIPVIQTNTGEFLAVDKSEYDKILKYLNQRNEKDKPRELFVAIKDSKGDIQLVKADEFGFRDTEKSREFVVRVGEREFVLDSYNLSRTGIGQSPIVDQLKNALLESFGVREHTNSSDGILKILQDSMNKN